MFSVQPSMKARSYRRKAAMCDSYAACARSSAAHEQLLHMREGYLSLAANADRLDGLPPMPPASAAALAVAA